MLLHLILLIFASDNDDITSKVSDNYENYQGKCTCSNCYSDYMQLPDTRAEDWENKRNEDNERQNQNNDHCLRCFLRYLFSCFSGRSNTLEMNEEP